jgi:hypothetical protein
MNDNDDLLCDIQQSDNQGHRSSQLLVEQLTTEQHLVPMSHRKKKCRGNRKEQHTRRRLRKRDLDEATTAHQMDTIIETQLTVMNTEVTDEPFDSIIAPIEEITQV